MHDTSINTSMRHIENTLIATDPGKERYDATLKELMSNRQFLSRILKRFVPGYEIETRGFYYAARRFSSQLRSITGPDDYAGLKKVYSIWLCMGERIPERASNTATLYNTRKDDIIGYIEKDASCYDLMDVIVIRLNGKKEVSDPVMELLRTIVDGQMGAEDKIERLKELGIREDRKIEEEVRDMGSFADAIERRALNKGIDQGMDNESRLFAKLYKVLNDQGKKDELEKAVFDPEYKKQLYRLYNIT